MKKESILLALKDAKRFSIETNIAYGRGINGTAWMTYGSSIKSDNNNQQWDKRTSIRRFLDDCLECVYEVYKNGELQTSYKVFLPYTSILCINVYE